ncbi:MAG TPA: phosphatase PAP2-related protein, partial [Burkholderiales bacterium]|nr:phosphatase PAP2-related protein [Burkholderiales bacterium]
VTYHVGNDFFFSGHTALAVYGAIQVASLNIPLLTVLATVIATLEAIVVIVLRAHWTADVLAGLFAAIAVGALIWPG